HGQPITCTSLQSKGLLNPLDEVVKAIGEDNIWEQVKRVCNVGGKQFGLVHAAGTSLLIYRKDIADKAGLKPPKTWNDLLANAKALTQSTKGDGKIGIVRDALDELRCDLDKLLAAALAPTILDRDRQTSNVFRAPPFDLISSPIRILMKRLS